jgi:hypothetical protein
MDKDLIILIVFVLVILSLVTVASAIVHHHRSKQTQVQAPSPQERDVDVQGIVASISSYTEYRYKFGNKATSGPRTRFLAYVDAGDGKLAPETPGFTAAAKAFFSKMKSQVCWFDAKSPCRTFTKTEILLYNRFPALFNGGLCTTFYANDIKKLVANMKYHEGVTQLLWDMCLTKFVSDFVFGDTLVLFLLTHGGINDETNTEFILGGVDENTLSELARRLPIGVNLLVYNSGCDQSRPIHLPIHYTVDAKGKEMVYDISNREATYNANIMTLTDTWSGYFSQFEPPKFPPLSGPRWTSPTYTTILFNFLASIRHPPGTIRQFYTAYTGGWHRLRPDEVPPPTSENEEGIIKNIENGTWNMFRPVLGLSSIAFYDAPLKFTCL